MTALDSAFVLLKAWLVGLFPEVLQPWVSMLVTGAAILGVFALLFGITTVLERKGLGRIQNRRVPRSRRTPGKETGTSGLLKVVQWCRDNVGPGRISVSASPRQLTPWDADPFAGTGRGEEAHGGPGRADAACRAIWQVAAQHRESG